MMRGPAQAVAAVNGWREKFTADGVPYYHNDITQALSWDKPADLKDDEEQEMDNSQWVWVPDAESGFVAARSAGGERYVQTNGRSLNYKLKKGETLMTLTPSSLKRLEDDLVLLDSLDEGMICHNLRERFMANQIYTNIGSILISINPFQRLPLYSPDIMEQYARKGTRQLPPHPFAIAERAFRNLLDYSENQSILVSGESGAGKTEATKQCLSFLAEVAGSQSAVEQRVLSANPILEAFGNAKTGRNDNSSRFGRFTSVTLNRANEISGATIQNYLLEKSRVSYQAPGERNYHVFFQLCASSWASSFNLQGPAQYTFLNGSGCTTVDGMDDAQEFTDVVKAMDMLGFTEGDKRSIFAIVAACLHLGNVQFQAATGGADGSRVANAAPAAAGAQFLGVDPSVLQQALCFRTIEINGESTTIPLRLEQARDNRDALTKYVYQKLFDWLVQRINRSLASPDSEHFIGILDIFGFEIFEKNSFEQLCINFTNEKLQQLFNEDTFKKEEQVYADEGIAFPHIEYIDNQPVLDLIEQRGGLFTMLDDAVRSPGKVETKDAKYSTQIDQAFANNNYFKPSNRHIRITFTAFSVHHYAGEVCYDVAGFVEKNADTLYHDMYSLMTGSSDGFVSALFPALTQDQRRRYTLAGQFKSQLNELTRVLRGTEPHYIRCVKPNSEKRPGRFMGTMCLEQLRYAGVFEAVQIRKKGYPFRYTFERFQWKYGCMLSSPNGWLRFTSRDAKQRCMELLAASGQEFPQIQVGHTMLMFRSDEYRTLELCRNLSLERVCSKIQAIARGRLTRRYMKLVARVKPTLVAAIASRDLAQLEAAIDRMNQVLGAFAGFSVAVPIKEMSQAAALKTALIEARRLQPILTQYAYSDLQDDNNFELLFGVVKESRVIAPQQPNPDFMALYATAVEQFEAWRTYRVQPRLEEALIMLERDELSAVYAEAKRLEYSDPEKFGEIESVLGMSEEMLLKRQYNKAREHGRGNRAEEKEVELKELYLDAHGAAFTMSNCQFVRDPMEFASAKLLPFGKEELALSMLEHTIKVIPTSLTKPAGGVSPEGKEMVRESIKLFKATLGYMGDKKYQYPDTLAVEVISKGLANTELRQEIFCQLMKQLTKNADPASQTKGWQLLGLCLLHFAPGPALENYVLMFLRNNAPASLKDNYIKQAHAIGYDRTPKSPPSEGTLHNLLNNIGVDRVVSSRW